ncbi:TPA: hypothetical protein N0F65_009759 [Lagenidium giganteum]|uniref:DNA-directed primase/polymerase protein n=1 Tax=Lagenidium giganteum TaxID=4803 RepID=A0AAV2YP71_9STRA|nr:TPA: hypothetical protein N0F65_009759 [Lagenidium giganteum]
MVDEWLCQELLVWTGVTGIGQCTAQNAEARDVDVMRTPLVVSVDAAIGIHIRRQQLPNGSAERVLWIPQDHLALHSVHHVTPFQSRVVISVDLPNEQQQWFFMGKIGRVSATRAAAALYDDTDARQLLRGLHTAFPDVPLSPAARDWIAPRPESLLRKRRRTLTASSFYGHSPSAQPSLQSDTHQLWTRFRERLQFSIERSQQCQLEGSAPVSAIFPRQVEAFEFAADVLAFRRSLVNRHALQAAAGTDDWFPRVFAFEGASDGRRRFLVTTLAAFWKQYKETASSERHVYEIIRENVPCRLYFDLEFSKPLNPGVDGDALVARLVCLLQVQLFRCYQMAFSKTGHIVQLDSSTDAKFSRHLIIHLPGNVLFKNNLHVGAFVRSMVSDLISTDAASPFDVEGSDGKTLFIDLGVYTRHRMFRIWKSSKYRKHVCLEYHPPVLDHAPDGPLMLKRSLVCPYASTDEIASLPDSSQPQLIFFEHGVVSTNRARLGPSPRDASRSAIKCTEGRSSTLPELDAFILSQATKGGIQGDIRAVQMLFPANDTDTDTDPVTRLPYMLVYHMARNRWCQNIQRAHKSNNIMFVVDLDQRVWYQKCHDATCKAIDYSSLH